MKRIRTIVKLLVNATSLAAAFVPALAAGFGKWNISFTAFAHCFSLFPGIPGDYLRTAYYCLTLKRCSMSSRVSFGSFFAQSDSEVGERVYIGAYCIIGLSCIGNGTMIASTAQVLSGRHQHSRIKSGEFSEVTLFRKTTIGDNCFIGTGAIVMENVGNGSDIGAGSVVTRAIDSFSIAVGNPARVIRTTPGGIADNNAEPQIEPDESVGS